MSKGGTERSFTLVVVVVVVVVGVVVVVWASAEGCDWRARPKEKGVRRVRGGTAGAGRGEGTFDKRRP